MLLCGDQDCRYLSFFPMVHIAAALILISRFTSDFCSFEYQKALRQGIERAKSSWNMATTDTRGLLIAISSKPSIIQYGVPLRSYP